MTGELRRGEGLREIANASTARGSFSFDPDELRSLIRKWEDLAYSYEQSSQDADSMIRITGPGEDFASEAHAKAANASGQSYLDYLEHNRRYCLTQAQTYQSALDEYLGAEDTNAAGFNKTDPKV